MKGFLLTLSLLLSLNAFADYTDRELHKNYPQCIERNTELKNLIKLDCDDSWVEQTILEAVNLLSSDIFPEASSNCDNCSYLRARWRVSSEA